MSDMTPEKALMIVDPDTREAALTGAMGCRPLRAAYITEACRVLAADYRKLSGGLGLATEGLAGALTRATAERDAAVRDLERLMNRYDEFEVCLLCKKQKTCKEIAEKNPALGIDEFLICDPKWRGPQQKGVPV